MLLPCSIKYQTWRQQNLTIRMGSKFITFKTCSKQYSRPNKTTAPNTLIKLVELLPIKVKFWFLNLFNGELPVQLLTEITMLGKRVNALLSCRPIQLCKTPAHGWQRSLIKAIIFHNFPKFLALLPPLLGLDHRTNIILVTKATTNRTRNQSKTRWLIQLVTSTQAAWSLKSKN